MSDIIPKSLYLICAGRECYGFQAASTEDDAMRQAGHQPGHPSIVAMELHHGYDDIIDADGWFLAPASPGASAPEVGAETPFGVVVAAGVYEGLAGGRWLKTDLSVAFAAREISRPIAIAR